MKPKDLKLGELKKWFTTRNTLFRAARCGMFVCGSSGVPKTTSPAEALRPRTPVKIFRELEVRPFASTTEVQEMLIRAHPTANPWFLRELLWAFENDIEATQLEAGRSSQAFEDSVAEFCRTSEVSVQTEADLKSAGGVTPDVFFSSPVTFSLDSGDSYDFCWLECKNFHAGAENRLILRTLERQAKKYTKALGPGAIVCAGGASQKVRETLQNLGVATLDGAHFASSRGELPNFVSGKADFWPLRYEELFKYQKSGPGPKRKTKKKNAEKATKRRK